MVGLRKRTSRPSYSVIADELVDLSDNDNDNDNDSASGSGSGSDQGEGESEGEGSAGEDASALGIDHEGMGGEGSRAGDDRMAGSLGKAGAGVRSGSAAVNSAARGRSGLLSGNAKSKGKGKQSGKGIGKRSGRSQGHSRAQSVESGAESTGSEYGEDQGESDQDGESDLMELDDEAELDEGPADGDEDEDEDGDGMAIDPALQDINDLDPSLAHGRSTFPIRAGAGSSTPVAGDGGRSKPKGRAKAHHIIQYGLPSSSGNSFPGSSNQNQQGNNDQPTGIQLVPPAYRALIKDHSESITASRGNTKIETKREARPTKLAHSLLPFGPSSRFTTTLKKWPKGRDKAQVVKVDEIGTVGSGSSWSERKKKRQHRQAVLVQHTALVAPWQGWQGEGWYPEMCRGEDSRQGEDGGAGPSGLSRAAESVGGQSKLKGKGKEKVREVAQPIKVLTRDQVRLGLDDVGRLKPDQIHFLSASEAEVYLPTTMDSQGNPFITCMMGPHTSQVPVNFSAFDSNPIEQYNQTKKGHVFSAGGPIWGLDWCPYPDVEDPTSSQYLAVSALPHLDTKPALGEKWPKDTPGSIQIWSITAPLLDPDDSVKEEGSMRCEVVLCVQGGSAMDLKWMPLGAWDKLAGCDLGRNGLPKLGILAATHLDGSISFWAVPHPNALRQVAGPSQQAGIPLYLKLDQPLLRLEIPDAMCMCIDWLSGSRIIAGLSEGHVAAWDVVDALKSGTGVAPMYFQTNQSAIRSIAVGRVPPSTSVGEPDYTQDPVYLVCGSHDATATLVDLRDPLFPIDILATRAAVHAVGWASQMNCPLYVDSDHVLAMHRMRGNGLTTFSLAPHRGPVWNVATSDFHTMVVTSSADGSVTLCTYQSGTFRRKGSGLRFQRMYDMDYDHHSGQYRMLDDYLPEEMALDAAVSGHLASKKKANSSSADTGKGKGKGQIKAGNDDQKMIKTGNWSPHVGIHTAVWNSVNLGKGGWVVSGGGSGLGRVDFVEGRFANDFVPPDLGTSEDTVGAGGGEGEGEGGMEVDEED